MFAIPLVNAVPKILCKPEQVSELTAAAQGKAPVHQTPGTPDAGRRLRPEDGVAPRLSCLRTALVPSSLHLHLAFDKGLRVRDLV